MSNPKIIFLLGPTAVGKSQFALKISRKINAEIISCDSMQVYKGMDIISSKPSMAMRKRILHHLIDVVSPREEFNVASYRGAVLRATKSILKRKKIPIFVGGTGFYASAVLDGIFKGPGEDKKIRERLYRVAEERGAKYLYNRLLKIDYQAAQKIHPNDLKRVIRALEVWIKTKKPISQWQKERRGIFQDYNVEIYCLNRPRQELYERINQRVDNMFKQGLVGEVSALLKKGLSKTASSAIGINEITGYLERRYSLDEAKELIRKHTRQYAKRQLTWFRKDKRINWVNIDDSKTRFKIGKY